MTAREGPPEGGGAHIPADADHHHPITARHHPNGTFNANTRRSHIGRYASGWRDGFRAGAADALRLAARLLPAETWHTLTRLADEYDLAGSDG
jgi:hypothetical protein